MFSYPSKYYIKILYNTHTTNIIISRYILYTFLSFHFYIFASTLNSKYAWLTHISFLSLGTT